MFPSASHVGVAIFHPPGFPAQWVLVLSADELFQGRVICASAVLTVDGLHLIWAECNPSPATFNLTAVFAGVIHIAALVVPMELVQSELTLNTVFTTNSEDPAHTDRYVLQWLSHIGYSRFGPSLLCMEKELKEAIRARIPLLNQCPSTGSSYAVASLSLDGVRVGKSRH